MNHRKFLIPLNMTVIQISQHANKPEATDAALEDITVLEVEKETYGRIHELTDTESIYAALDFK